MKHLIEGQIPGRIKVTKRGGRRREQLLNDLMEKTGYWKYKEEALDCTLRRTRKIDKRTNS
jgi:hypothetical protein